MTMTSNNFFKWTGKAVDAVCPLSYTYPVGGSVYTPHVSGTGSVTAIRAKESTAFSTIHRVPVYYVEYRGWSQEVHVLHIEQPEDQDKRFCAVGRHTAYDKDRTLTTYGATAEEAIEKIQDAIETAPFMEHYKSINDQFLELRNEIERLTKLLPPVSVDPVTVSSIHEEHG